MKKLFLIIPALLLAQLSLLAQKPTTTSDKEATTKATDAPIKMDTPVIEKVSVSPPKYKFNETTFNFGDLKQNNPATHVFEFTNTGTEPISLENVQATCGCTIPQWDKNPIAAGKTGTITVVYNSANPGNFTKTITVKFINGETDFLTITGVVEPAPVVPVTPEAPVTPEIKPN